MLLHVQRLTVHHTYCTNTVQTVQSATELYLHIYTEADAICSVAQQERNCQAVTFLSLMQLFV
jgi:hypothetical protein